MLDWLIGPLTYPFMLRGLGAAMLVGAVCAVLGTYVVLRGMAFFGDALAHAILPGVAVAYLARWPLSAGALAAGLLAAAAIGYLQNRVREDTAIGIVFSGAFALGIVLLSTVRTYTVDLTHFLFGNVLGVSPADLIVTVILSGGVLLLTVAFHKELVLVAFDPVLATVLRLPTSLLRYLLLLLLAITVVAALQVVGVALVVAMLVTPPATAYLLVRRVGPMMGLAALFGTFSAAAGLYASYYLNIPSGPAMVLVCTAIFLASLFLSRRTGRRLTPPPAAVPPPPPPSRTKFGRGEEVRGRGGEPVIALTRRDSRREAVAAALEFIADQVDLRTVRQVLVKPNFVVPDRQLAATHVDAVRAVLEFLRARYDGPIIVAEGTALRDTWEAFANYGYLSLPDEYDVVLMDLNGDETVPVTVYDRHWRPLTLQVARTVVESDYRISVCPPKTHDTVLVTLSIKNMVMGALVNPGAVREGTAPLYRMGRRLPTWLKQTPPAQLAKRLLSPAGSHKMAMHQGIPVININLALAARAVWPHLAVIDGWEGMEGAGPGHGDPVPWRIALAGTDPLAVDALTASLMGFNPDDVGYLHYCRRLGLGVAELENITVVGDLSPETARRPFRPHPTAGQQRQWRSREAMERLQALGARSPAPEVPQGPAIPKGAL